ncbi:hypothetical protein GCM10009630_10170 [Kribbella jejuensis]|uniref:hypothetical protein n=1 Tax=Kribbella jejuensis TaxID=236068 RepID=UPI00114DB4C6|nr:hypothetical protein [Kribbella jejuensis]
MLLTAFSSTSFGAGAQSTWLWFGIAFVAGLLIAGLTVLLPRGDRLGLGSRQRSRVGVGRARQQHMAEHHEDGDHERRRQDGERHDARPETGQSHR